MARQIKARAAKPAAKATIPASNKAAAKPATIAKAVAKPATAYAHFVEGMTAYTGLRDGKLKGALTQAALIVAGHATMKGDSIAKAGKGSAVMFRNLAGDNAYGEWRKQKRLTKAGDELTAGGIDMLNERLTSTGNPYHTTPDIVRAFVAAMTKGGKVEIAGHAPVTFARKVTG